MHQIKIISPKFWVRTCQECGNRQIAHQPNQTKELTDAYREALCKRCHSVSLDYGSRQGL